MKLWGAENVGGNRMFLKTSYGFVTSSPSHVLFDVGGERMAGFQKF
jgi:hypothetical protein